MKVIILARVSTEEQKEAGNSLSAQSLRLKKYCLDKKLTIFQEYTFDESAWKSDRQEFKKIVRILQNSKEKMVLCCDKIDRLTRCFSKELVMLEELRRKGNIELHFPSDNIILNQDSPATDLFRFTMGVSLAKYFSDSISDNIKRAYENKIKNGEWIGKAPAGYLNTTDEKGNKNIIPDPERAPFIIKMFEMYASGNYSMRQIVQEINKMGYKSNTKEPKPLILSRVVQILENPFYYGYMRIKKRLYKHKYQPLISTELYFKTKRTRVDRCNLPVKIESKPYIFRGLIKCTDCGCAITPETKKGYVYYSCTNYRKYHSKRTYVREEVLLEPIYEVLDNIKLTDYQIKELVDDLKQVTKAENHFFTNSLKALQKDFDRYENRLNRLADDRYDGVISKEFYNKKFEEYSIEQENILAKINKYNKADKDHYITANVILNLAQRAREIFESSEVHEKRHLLGFLLQNCKLKDKKLHYKLKTPFDTVLLASGCSEMWTLKVAFRTIDWQEVADNLTMVKENNLFSLPN